MGGFTTIFANFWPFCRFGVKSEILTIKILAGTFVTWGTVNRPLVGRQLWHTVPIAHPTGLPNFLHDANLNLAWFSKRERNHQISSCMNHCFVLLFERCGWSMLIQNLNQRNSVWHGVAMPRRYMKPSTERSRLSAALEDCFRIEPRHKTGQHCCCAWWGEKQPLWSVLWACWEHRGNCRSSSYMLFLCLNMMCPSLWTLHTKAQRIHWHSLLHVLFCTPHCFLIQAWMNCSGTAFSPLECLHACVHATIPHQPSCTADACIHFAWDPLPESAHDIENEWKWRNIKKLLLCSLQQKITRDMFWDLASRGAAMTHLQILIFKDLFDVIIVSTLFESRIAILKFWRIPVHMYIYIYIYFTHAPWHQYSIYIYIYIDIYIVYETWIYTRNEHTGCEPKFDKLWSYPNYGDLRAATRQRQKLVRMRNSYCTCTIVYLVPGFWGWWNITIHPVQLYCSDPWPYFQAPGWWWYVVDNSVLLQPNRPCSCCYICYHDETHATLPSRCMLMGLKRRNLSVEEHLICGECGDVLDGAEMPVDMPAASPELLLIFGAWFLNRPVSNKSSDPKTSEESI